MPRRNLVLLFLVTLVALLCYDRVQKTPYGRVMAEAMTTIENRYLEPVKASKLFEKAMDGMVGDLDPNSMYITPAELKEFYQEIDLQFEGVGMEVGVDPETKQLIVLSPLSGSPASKAGILAGDKLLRIGHDSTQGMSLQDAIGLLRGKAGEPVTLTIQHEGEDKPLELTLVRDKIQIESIQGDTRNADGSWNFFLEGHPTIAYVRITSFTDKTAEEMEKVLARLADHDIRGLILDMRDNPGGYVDAAVALCDMLVPNGKEIVTVRRRGGVVSERYTAMGQDPYLEFPIAVLVNNMSASAAEIVASCLQDNHRAAVIGERSYGKGTIQELIDLEKGCGAMKITTASYWRPNGKNIHRPANAGPKDVWGVTPNQDYQVSLTGEEQNHWRIWRAKRDTFQPTANGTTKNGNSKNNSATKKPAPFVDRVLIRAVEYVEKESAKSPASAPSE
jgi:carboxyl-terminal processing protease